jgi:hypothetical protein
MFLGIKTTWKNIVAVFEGHPTDKNSINLIRQLETLKNISNNCDFLKGLANN